ncbi:MAG TPA: hypothetical protein VNJ53_05095 [Gaiellaceae bacterium]|nr:hypothetical protein [Gaiellaceae bacterium]
MRTLVFLCALALGAALAGSATAQEPPNGLLSVEGGRGVVALELRGSVLGRLGAGVLRVTDLTPRDRFGAFVVGRKLEEERIGPRTVVYRGQGLRFRMLGGGYRIVVRGSGISLSVVGRGAVVLDGEPRLLGEDVGVYSLDGADCGLEPERCAPLPDLPQRFQLGLRPEEGSRSAR